MHIFSKIIVLICLITITNYSQSTSPVIAKNGMVVSASDLSTDVGVEILKDGGNAIDAAVATGFALAVTFPQAGNLGGGGFMVIRFKDGTSTTIDYREKAPDSAHKDMFLDSNGEFELNKSTSGTLSSGVPGSVAGLLYVHKKYGKLPFAKVILPAINLANDGFILSESLARSINYRNDIFNKYESSKEIFTNNGDSLRAGDLFIQKDLANTLIRIREKGFSGFYEGYTAECIVKQMNTDGGYISLADLKAYTPIEREPLYGDYKGHKIISMGPPSSGGVALIQMLNLLERTGAKHLGNDDLNSYYHYLLQAMRYAYTDRAVHLGDMDFYDVPLEWLISDKYADEIVSKNVMDSDPSESFKAGTPKKVYESDETTHYSVIDSEGNAVSTTTTINSSYGNKIVVKCAGFLLNNEMDDFSAKPGEPNQFGLIGSEANSIEPHKRMLSSMTPTIVEKDGKPYIIIGSPGGSTIITTVVLVILNIIDFDKNIYEALAHPRIHHQAYPNKIYFEKNAITEELKTYLLSKGHTLGRERTLGRAQGIIILDSVYTGASDPRAYGKAAGY